MRTIIDLPDDLLAQLDALKKTEHVSRAELIRRAVRAYLSGLTQPNAQDARAKAFGLWRQPDRDALEIEESLRKEWDEV